MLLLAFAVLLLMSGCEPGDPPPPPDPIPTGADPISRATRYLASSNPDDDPSVSLILDYLRRRYSISGLGGQISHGADLSRDPTNQLFLYGRIFDPAARLEQFATPANAGIDSAKMSSVAYFPLLALHCDRWPLPSGFDSSLRAEVAKGGYFTTHAVVARQWGMEQGCYESSSELTEVLRAGLVENAERHVNGDIFAESLAMLYYGGFGESVRPEWIETLKRTQRADGSFPFDNTELLPRHSTSLALWALCGAEGIGDPAVTWIPDPGPPAKR
ncbi:MAG: hypothetical protein DCC49_07030 [Acidobacteria bacterium]|nr:MAG: hypothetical protein DCC49_07030 [Acidobacteriota bacterium]